MIFTFRALIEFGFGLCLVAAAVLVKMNQSRVSTLTDLLLTLLSLGGIAVMAHAIWLARRRE